MEIRQAFVDGKLMDVVTQEEYERRVSMKNDDMIKNTCIEQDGTIYPVVSRPEMRRTPHVINVGPVFKYVGSCEDGFPSYSSSKIIDYSSESLGTRFGNSSSCSLETGDSRIKSPRYSFEKS